jgi:Neugrin
MESLFRLGFTLCRRHSLKRFYTTDITSASLQKWRLLGIPRPRSILEDDDAPVDLSEDNEIVNGVKPNTPPPHLRQPPDKPTPHEFKGHRAAMRRDFPDGWSPPRKLSREAMEGLRELHRFDPEKFNTPVLAEKFKISPEGVRRILKSKWSPSREKRMKLAERERKERSEHIKLNRLRERIEVRQLAELEKFTKKGKGKSSVQDKFTFE